MLMFLARNEVISNACHWHAFPPSPRTLWELTQIRPKCRPCRVDAILPIEGERVSTVALISSPTRLAEIGR
jgi:hypothetical protein